MRVLKIILGVLIVLPISLYLVREPLIKMAVNNIGSAVVGTEVSLADVTFSPFSGLLELKGLTVANPTGYKTTNAIKLGGVRVQLDPNSLLTSRIQVQEIIISEPEITIEGGMKNNNLTALQKNMASEDTTTENTTTTEPETGSTKKVEIDLVRIEDGKVNVTKPFPLSASLGTIIMRDIGKEDNKDVSVAEFFSTVINTVIKSSTTAASSEMAAKGKEMINQAGEGATNAIDKIGAKLKGLFGN